MPSASSSSFDDSYLYCAGTSSDIAWDTQAGNYTGCLDIEGFEGGTSAEDCEGGWKQAVKTSGRDGTEGRRSVGIMAWIWARKYEGKQVPQLEGRAAVAEEEEQQQQRSLLGVTLKPVKWREG